MAPQVSVIIPTYNREFSLRQSVESVLRQTFADIEVIVVDDCSEDATSDVLSQICDSRLRVLTHDRNRGGSAARNTGIRAARGKYVAFQDSDDEWLPTKLEKQIAALETSSPDSIGVYCGMVVVGAVESDAADSVLVRYLPAPRIRVPLEGELEASLLRARSFISTQTFVARRDVLIACGAFDESLAALQDWDCFIRLAAHGPIAFVKEPLVIQRFSPNSLTRSARNRVDAMSRILAKYQDQFRRVPAVLAEHYYVLGGGYRRLGDQSAATEYYILSFKLAPWQTKTLLLLVYTVLQRTVSCIVNRLRRPCCVSERIDGR